MEHPGGGALRTLPRQARSPAARRPTAATARPGRASATATPHRCCDEPAVARALRRAALPLQLQLPRRREPARGARRAGEAARAGGDGAHRPRRHVRRGPLRRGGGRAGRRHGVRHRALAGPVRPAERRGRPGGHPPAAARPRSRGLPRALPHDQRRPAARRGEGPPGLRPRRAGRAHRGPRRSRSPAAARARSARRWRRAAAIPRGSCGGCASGSGPTTWPSSSPTRACPPTPSATTRWPRSPRDAGLPTIVTTAAHYATPDRFPLATALAAVRARRSLDDADGWLPPGGHRAPALRCGAHRPLRAPPPGCGGARGGVRARVRVLDPAGGAQPAAVPGAAGARPR